MLPSNFLREIAENYELTEKEQEVFLEKFGSNKSEQAIANQLHLSSSAIRNRLSGVYRKFSISGSGPVKSEQLFRFLTKEHQESHPTPLAESLGEESDIDTLVQEVREKVCLDIQTRCGWMRVLEMTHPIGLGDIYTEVNILEKILGRRQIEIAQLLESCNREDFDRFGLERVTEKRVPGLDAVERYSKLMILGKPGAGKTTFLRRVATQCNQGKFLTNRVPIFITLKDFAEAAQQPGLLQYITHGLAQNEVSDPGTTAKTLLREGRAVILLDGLDEVRQADNDRVLKEIRDFSIRFNANHFVITCRIAAKEYTFEQFTEVEVADFDDQQIAEFATHWFQAQDPKKALQFIEKLKKNQRIKELATNPLLLTLLCLLFGESTDFPANRSELYEQGLDVLLRKWDGTRGIERDQAYCQLSLKRKEDLLSQIALTTFKQGNYFFKQRQAQQYITDYIQNLLDAPTNPEALELDSRAILKSIEAQHGLLIERARGIYSFSHLTFHEFFTARNIALSRHPQQAFQQLVRHMKDKSWREVFLLTVGILPNADDLVRLMKQHVDGLVASDEKIQKFLSWVNRKSLPVKATYKPAVVRAFYLDLASNLDLARDRALASNRASTRDLVRALALDLARALDLAHVNARVSASASALARALARDRAHVSNLASTLASDLDLACASARDLACASARVSDLDLASDLALTCALSCALSCVSDLDLASDLAHVSARVSASASNLTSALVSALVSDLASALASALALDLESELQQSLQELKAQLPNLNNSKKSKEIHLQWWQVNGQNWIERLNVAMIKERNIGHDWQFTQPELELLSQYYFANQLLVDCLNSECYVSREVRQEIEDTLLLPIE